MAAFYDPSALSAGSVKGCPASSIIFVIAVEILASKLRQNRKIKGS